MSTNLYDLLDVEESATAEEIRAAWKRAIADLDPTERRFRAYNDAAGVLLDPAKRASYDDQLTLARLEDAVAEAGDVEPDKQPGDGPGDRPGDRLVGRATAAGPFRAALIAAGIAALLAAALAVWVLTLPGVRNAESPRAVTERATSQQRATVSAESAAEQMVAPVLSYHHESMAADLDRLTGFLTDQMAEKQTAAWPELTAEAEAQQVVVEARPVGAALTRVAPDGRRATVVVFIDQYVEKAAAEPFVLRMWATMSLVRTAGSESRWLLDDLCTDDSCG